MSLVLVGVATFALGVVAMLLVSNLAAPEKEIDFPLSRVFSVEDAQFRREMSVLLGPPILEGNEVEVLLNGDRIFGAMLAAIRSATRSINFETYIYWEGTIGQEFAVALADRAKAGVEVHVLLDWIGSAKVNKSELDEMRNAGVQVERFHKPRLARLPHLNNRTHRKLLIVDGETGFTGGVGIADKWRGNAQDADHWRDSHFQVRGPVVAQIQAVFIDNWTKATRRVLHGDSYFPTLLPLPGVAAQMFSSSPSGGADSMQLMYLLAITSAAKSIDLQSAYFVPGRLTLNALVEARRRGVKVRIITPGPDIDSELVRDASRELWGPLLESGVVIAEYQPTMYHCKVLVVDGLLTSVGSTNFDNRSFRLNDEANLNVLDAGFAAEQLAIFETDLAHSTPITLADWKNRPFSQKVRDQLAILLRAQI